MNRIKIDCHDEFFCLLAERAGEYAYSQGVSYYQCSKLAWAATEEQLMGCLDGFQDRPAAVVRDWLRDQLAEHRRCLEIVDILSGDS